MCACDKKPRYEKPELVDLNKTYQHQAGADCATGTRFLDNCNSGAFARQGKCSIGSGAGPANCVKGSGARGCSTGTNANVGACSPGVSA